MKTATRFGILAGCVLLCGGGAIVANSSRDRVTNIDRDDARFGANDFTDAYRYAASDAPQKLTFTQIEALIRCDPTTKSQRGRIEFGSVKMERGTAVVQVLFVEDGERMQPFLYTLVPEKNSWKVQSARRMWFVPRSHFLRGVRA